MSPEVLAFYSVCAGNVPNSRLPLQNASPLVDSYYSSNQINIPIHIPLQGQSPLLPLSHGNLPSLPTLWKRATLFAAMLFLVQVIVQPLSFYDLPTGNYRHSLLTLRRSSPAAQSKRSSITSGTAARGEDLCCGYFAVSPMLRASTHLAACFST